MLIKLSGAVISGAGSGRKLGFPTVNLSLQDCFGSERILAETLKVGVYAGVAVLSSGQKFSAGIVIGPLLGKWPKVEAHLVGFSGDLYGEKVVLELREFLRNFKIYEKPEQLISQIEADLVEVKRRVKL